jgi:hypothetical protein
MCAYIGESIGSFLIEPFFKKARYKKKRVVAQVQYLVCRKPYIYIYIYNIYI